MWYKPLKDDYERETSFFIGGVLQIRNFKLSHVSEICVGNVCCPQRIKTNQNIEEFQN